MLLPKTPELQLFLRRLFHYHLSRHNCHIRTASTRHSVCHSTQDRTAGEDLTILRDLVMDRRGEMCKQGRSNWRPENRALRRVLPGVSSLRSHTRNRVQHNSVQAISMLRPAYSSRTRRKSLSLLLQSQSQFRCPHSLSLPPILTNFAVCLSARDSSHYQTNFNLRS